MNNTQFKALLKATPKEHKQGLLSGWLTIREYFDGYQSIVEAYSINNTKKELVVKIGF